MEAESNGKTGEEVKNDIVESEFIEKREGRKVSNSILVNTEKTQPLFSLMSENLNISEPKVHTYTWLPAGKPRALLFLCHG